PAKYLAYDRGKVAVASTTGIFILDINDFIPSLSTTFKMSPIPSTSLTFTIPEFNSISLLGGISCLQISDSGIYLNWDPDQLRTSMWDERHRGSQEVLQRLGDGGGMPGSFDDDNQNDTYRRQESQFLAAEDTFRKTMQRKGSLLGAYPTWA
ncbi:hypothetical protein MPER_02013, partial [Moniliophthora perniciosa FA553]